MRCLGFSDGITVAAITITDFTDLLLQTGPAVLLPQMASSLGFGSPTAAHIAAAFTIASVVSKTGSGPLADVLGGKPMLVMGLVLMALANAMIGGAREVGLLTLFFVLVNTGHGTSSPASRSHSPIRRGRSP